MKIKFKYMFMKVNSNKIEVHNFISCFEGKNIILKFTNIRQRFQEIYSLSIFYKYNF